MAHLPLAVTVRSYGESRKGGNLPYYPTSPCPATTALNGMPPTRTTHVRAFGAACRSDAPARLGLALCLVAALSYPVGLVTFERCPGNRQLGQDGIAPPPSHHADTKRAQKTARPPGHSSWATCNEATRTRKQSTPVHHGGGVWVYPRTKVQAAEHVQREPATGPARPSLCMQAAPLTRALSAGEFRRVYQDPRGLTKATARVHHGTHRGLPGGRGG